MKVSFVLNGEPQRIEADPERRLVTILREDLAQTATKEACSIGRCGACMVLMDGRAVNSCLLMAYQLEGADITTTEGLAGHQLAATIRKAMIAENAFQCGYCAPGFVMALIDLLTRNPQADEDTIRSALEGNICRCTGYHSIIRGALSAVRLLRETSILAGA